MARRQAGKLYCQEYGLRGRNGARVDKGADNRRVGSGSEEGWYRQWPEIGADAGQGGYSTQAARGGGHLLVVADGHLAMPWNPERRFRTV